MTISQKGKRVETSY